MAVASIRDPAIAAEPEVTRPRVLERRLALVRWFGVALGLYLVSQAHAGPEPVSRGAVPVATGLLLVLGAANLALALLLSTGPGDRALRRAGAAMFVADAATVVAIVWLFGTTRDDATWALLYVLPLEGALRYEMPGALGALAVCAVSELAREGALAARDPAVGYLVPEVAFRIGVGVMVAAVAGLMSRSLRQEADRLRHVVAIATKAEREASAFATVILAGVRATTATDAMDAVADAVGTRLAAERCVIVGRDLEAEPLGRWPRVGPVPLLHDEPALLARAIEGREPVVRRPTDRGGAWTLVAPLAARDEVVGAILAGVRPGAIAPEEALVLLSRLAVQVGVILEDVRIRDEQRATLRELQRQEAELRSSYQLLRRTDEQRRKLLSRLVAAQEQERHSIATRIQDEPLQDVVALELRLAALDAEVEDPHLREHLDAATETARAAMRRIRLLLVELEPPPLDRAGIVATLTSYLEEVRPAADVRITSHLAPEPPPETAVIAYRLAQQGLVNALRQAGASEVDVLFRGLDRGVYLRIADDGDALGARAPGAGPRELALAEMRERAELSGGWSHVLSVPGAGTIVECWIPLASGGAVGGAERPGTADLRPSTLDPRKG